MHSNSTNSEIITALEEKLRKGDKQAFDELFSCHRERLMKIVIFRLDHQLHGRLDPEDVVQEAYMAALKRFEHFGKDFSGSSFVWLRLIAQQTLVDLQRFHLGAQKRDAGKEVVKRPSTSRTMTLHLFGQVSSPSRAVMQVDMMDRVEQAISTMDPTDQEILAMRHFEELTNKETAEVLDIAQKAASIRYFRALKRLKDILGQYSVFLDGASYG